MNQQEINYPWHEAPDWAQWAAEDQNGRAFWYEEKPKLMYTIWAVYFGRSLHLNECSNLENINWKKSLQKRPNT